MTPASPARAEVWLIDFGATRGHEQAGVRPGVIISADGFNTSGASLSIALPITATRRSIALHIAVRPPEGGLRRPSFVKCEDIRSVAFERLIARWGEVSARTMSMIEDRLRTLLEL